LKRTRHIEVIRYTRRVTASRGTAAADAPSDEQLARDLMLDALALIPATLARLNGDESAAEETATADPPRRRLLSSLGHLLRLGK
jgi:hypothetical protein